MRRTMLAVLVLLTAVAAFAQSPVVVERIDVIATRTRPEIVIAEMRLPKGGTYTTDQIEQAVYRVRRLPFVADATYTLEPGVAPGARVLRVTIVDETRFSFNFDIEGVAQRGGYATALSEMGFRVFPAKTGVLEIAPAATSFATGGGSGGGHLGDVRLQYRAYGLVGGAYAVAGVTTKVTGSNRLVSPTLVVGVPLAQTQTIQARYGRVGDKLDNQSIAAVEWLWQRTDDPYFARTGFSVTAGPQWERVRIITDYNLGSSGPGHVPTIVHSDTKIKGTGFGLVAERYWPLGESSAAWANASGTHFSETQTNNGRSLASNRHDLGDAAVGVAHNFDASRNNPLDQHRLRVELGAGYHRDHTSYGSPGSVPFDRSGPEVVAGIAYRNRYGIFRLAVRWVSSD